MDTENRPIYLAHYIINTRSTVRATAKVYGVSKSTVHADVTKRLKRISPYLYEKVHEILSDNFNEKHIRGGMATKRKYEKLKTDK